MVEQYNVHLRERNITTNINQCRWLHTKASTHSESLMSPWNQHVRAPPCDMKAPFFHVTYVTTHFGYFSLFLSLSLQPSFFLWRLFLYIADCLFPVFATEKRTRAYIERECSVTRDIDAGRSKRPTRRFTGTTACYRQASAHTPL